MKLKLCTSEIISGVKIVFLEYKYEFTNACIFKHAILPLDDKQAIGFMLLKSL